MDKKMISKSGQEEIKEEQIKANIPGLPKAEIIKISNKLNKEVFDDDALTMPIDAFRIIFKAVSDLRNKQFLEEENQLSLDFEQTFKNENNSYARFTFSVKDIIKDQRHERIEAALTYLESYKKDWYEGVNSKGEKVKTLISFISNPEFTEKGKVTFLINHYWLKQMLHIKPYNTITYSVIDRFSNKKHILFYLWLLQIDPATGTKISVSTLNKRYGLNYTSKSEIIRSFLMPIKKKLDSYGNFSFNMNKRPDDDNIYIAVYDTVPKIGISQPIHDKLYKKQKKSYIINRHQLTGKHKERVEIAIKYDNTFTVIEAYHNVMKYYRYKRKIKIEEIEQTELFDLWQKEIIKKYRETKKGKNHPDLFPLI